MLGWLARRLHGSPPPCGINRAGRRAMHRLARMPRGDIDHCRRLLRGLDRAQRSQVLDALPAAYRDAIGD